jgi:hypothetical protein
MACVMEVLLDSLDANWGERFAPEIKGVRAPRVNR